MTRDDPPAAAVVKLTAHLDVVTPDRIEGWAHDLDRPDEPVRLRVLDGDVVLGIVIADHYRRDLAANGIGTGHHSFSLTVPGGLDPHVRHVVRVQRLADGTDIANSPRIIEAVASAEPSSALPLAASGVVGAQATAAPTSGRVEHATRHLIAGWACDPQTPDRPVALQILNRGAVLGRVLANRYRPDLAAAGIGNGRHAFEFPIPGGLSPMLRHVIQVRAETDGKDLHNSPSIIEPATRFEPALKQVIADAIAAMTEAEDHADALAFLVAQTERLLQRHAAVEGQNAERLAYQQFCRRWGPAATAEADGLNPGKRALVIDAWIPVAGRDAGSQALLSHIRALQRLGYAVSLAAAEEMAKPAPALTALGIGLCGAPFYSSVEDVLRRQAGCFDVVYLHRADMATRYLPLVRRYAPRARLLYSVADLHHVRLQRQSIAEDQPALMAASHRMRVAECTAAWLSDGVITHSVDEVSLLQRAVPQASVYHVPWDVPVRTTAKPFAERRGVAFIGGYGHAPNVDAACFLVETIMPLVWQTDPDIECRLVGSAMPDAVARLAGPGIAVMGQVDDLGSAVFDRTRLTVAPLRYGAGVKGKVLESFAAGIPCVMSPIGAEGLALPADLQGLVGDGAAALAAHICRLHADEALNGAAATAGLVMIQSRFAAENVTQMLGAAIEGLRHRSVSPLDLAGQRP